LSSQSSLHPDLPPFPTRRSSDLGLNDTIAWTTSGATFSLNTIGNATLGLAGSNDTVTITGSNSAISITGSNDTVTVSGVTVSLRSEEHTSELQSRVDLVCRLLLE